jgi:dTDP-4-amino-4,6-dideoxygalactose transaminase
MTTNPPRIPLMRPLLPSADELLPYLRRIDESRWYSNFGPMVDAFEARLAETLGLTRAQLVCVTSGTIGLTTSLRAFDPPPGACCLMPSWTFAASALAVRWAGLCPWFVDVDDASWMLTPEIARAALRAVDRPVGAVMPVSAFGAPVDVAAWDRFRAETGVPVVIDAAAAFDCAVFGATPMVISLHATKVLGIGEGALIASRDEAFSARVRAFSNFGFVDGREAALPGINAKISEYAAAVGMAALDRWPRTRAAFAEATRRYQAAFADVAGVSLAPGISPSHLRSTLSIRLSQPVAESVMAALGEAGIAARQWWGKGCHRMPAFRDAPRTTLPVTEALAESVVGLPFSQDIDAADIVAVRDAVRGAVNG